MKNLSIAILFILGLTFTFSSCKDDKDTGTLPTVKTIAILNIYFNSAVVSGELVNVGSSDVTAKGIVFSNTQNPTIADRFTDHGSGVGTYESALSGLSPNTTYYFRAYATNSVGTQYGNEMTFKTLAK